MSNAALRILNAVQGDNDAICSLAAAVARNDLGAVRTLLEARGVTITDEEVSSVVGGATSGASAVTCTMTCTMT